MKSSGVAVRCFGSMLGELVRRGRRSAEGINRALGRRVFIAHGRAARHRRPRALYRRTGGNPFYLTGVLAAGRRARSRDSVTGRRSRARGAAVGSRQTACCWMRPRSFRGKVRAVAVGGARRRARRSIARRMPGVERNNSPPGAPHRCLVRHELARLAIEEAIRAQPQAGRLHHARGPGAGRPRRARIYGFARLAQPFRGRRKTPDGVFALGAARAALAGCRSRARIARPRRNTRGR